MSVRRDIIVIGASAGGVQVLHEILPMLPRDLPAAVFVVVHMPPWHKSRLPFVLSRNGSMPAEHAEGGERIRYGRIYVAPPDQHLYIEDDRVHLWRGPKENRHRPAINVLFRSAAVGYRKRVAGVILSGSLDDGTAGLWWIKHFGGIAMIQDPQEAQFDDMPRSALEHVDPDYVLRAAAIPPMLLKLARGHTEDEKVSPAEKVQE